jgi:hypothetical protein
MQDGRRGGCGQEEAARLLGVCERSFRRYIDRYEEARLDGLLDRRMAQVSGRRGAVDEVLGVVELYRGRYAGWNVRHFHNWYLRAHDGARSYSWVKNTLQAAGGGAAGRGAGGQAPQAPGTGADARHDVAPGWLDPRVGIGVRWDLIATMDDANGEHTSMFIVQGLFAMLYTDRASHYFHTPEAGGKVDKTVYDPLKSCSGHTLRS